MAKSWVPAHASTPPIISQKKLSFISLLFLPIYMNAQQSAVLIIRTDSFTAIGQNIGTNPATVLSRLAIPANRSALFVRIRDSRNPFLKVPEGLTAQIER